MSLRVLITDDSKVMRSVVRRALDMTGFRIGDVQEVGNGKEALDALAKVPYDLMLLDVNMPVLDGVEALRRVRDDEKIRDLPVVAITSEGSEERLTALTDMGASIVRKPFTAEILVDGIIQALGGGSGHANGTEIGDDSSF